MKKEKRKYKDALKCFERAVELNPSYTLAERAWKDVIEARKDNR